MHALSSLRDAFREDGIPSPKRRSEPMSGANGFRSSEPPRQSRDELAAQLATQIDQNNHLLEKLYGLEKQQLETQRELQEKQGVLRQALTICDNNRAEITELKRKLSNSEEVASRLREELKEAQVENGVVARELEGLRRYAQETQDDTESFRNEKSRLEEELEELRMKVGDNESLLTSVSHLFILDS